MTSQPVFLDLAITVLLWTLLGASWNLLGGFGGPGLLRARDLLGVGAYTTMIFYLKRLVSVAWDSWPAASSPLVRPAHRLDLLSPPGPYFSLATLAVAEITAHHRL